jgi:hypothetical protein
MNDNLQHRDAAVGQSDLSRGQADESAQPVRLPDEVIDPVGLSIRFPGQDSAGSKATRLEDGPWTWDDTAPGRYEIRCAGRFEISVTRWALEAATRKLVDVLNENWRLKQKVSALEQAKENEQDHGHGH